MHDGNICADDEEPHPQLSRICLRPASEKAERPVRAFRNGKHVLPVHAGSLRAEMCADLEASP